MSMTSAILSASATGRKIAPGIRWTSCRGDGTQSSPLHYSLIASRCQAQLLTVAPTALPGGRYGPVAHTQRRAAHPAGAGVGLTAPKAEALPTS